MSLKERKKIPFLGALLIILVVSILGLGAVKHFTEPDYLEANIIRVLKGNTIVIGNNCTAIVAETSPERARSIELGLKDEIKVRPNTHDIFAEVINSFNITLERVTLDSFSDNIYYANLYLKKGNRALKIDLKPSDAMALALRTESPIYIKKDLLNKMGQDICE